MTRRSMSSNAGPSSSRPPKRAAASKAEALLEDLGNDEAEGSSSKRKRGRKARDEEDYNLEGYETLASRKGKKVEHSVKGKTSSAEARSYTATAAGSSGVSCLDLVSETGSEANDDVSASSSSKESIRSLVKHTTQGGLGPQNAPHDDEEAPFDDSGEAEVVERDPQFDYYLADELDDEALRLPKPVLSESKDARFTIGVDAAGDIVFDAVSLESSANALERAFDFNEDVAGDMRQSIGEALRKNRKTVLALIKKHGTAILWRLIDAVQKRTVLQFTADDFANAIGITGSAYEKIRNAVYLRSPVGKKKDRPQTQNDVIKSVGSGSLPPNALYTGQSGDSVPRQSAHEKELQSGKIGSRKLEEAAKAAATFPFVLVDLDVPEFLCLSTEERTLLLKCIEATICALIGSYKGEPHYRMRRAEYGLGYMPGVVATNGNNCLSDITKGEGTRLRPSYGNWEYNPTYSAIGTKLRYAAMDRDHLRDTLPLLRKGEAATRASKRLQELEDLVRRYSSAFWAERERLLLEGDYVVIANETSNPGTSSLTGLWYRKISTSFIDGLVHAGFATRIKEGSATVRLRLVDAGRERTPFDTYQRVYPRLEPYVAGVQLFARGETTDRCFYDPDRRQRMGGLVTVSRCMKLLIRAVPSGASRERAMLETIAYRVGDAKSEAYPDGLDDAEVRYLLGDIRVVFLGGYGQAPIGQTTNVRPQLKKDLSLANLLAQNKWLEGDDDVFLRLAVDPDAATNSRVTMHTLPDPVTKIEYSQLPITPQLTKTGSPWQPMVYDYRYQASEKTRVQHPMKLLEIASLITCKLRLALLEKKHSAKLRAPPPPLAFDEPKMNETTMWMSGGQAQVWLTMRGTNAEHKYGTFGYKMVKTVGIEHRHALGIEPNSEVCLRLIYWKEQDRANYQLLAGVRRTGRFVELNLDEDDKDHLELLRARMHEIPLLCSPPPPLAPNEPSSNSTRRPIGRRSKVRLVTDLRASFGNVFKSNAPDSLKYPVEVPLTDDHKRALDYKDGDQLDARLLYWNTVKESDYRVIFSKGNRHIQLVPSAATKRVFTEIKNDHTHYIR